MHTDERWQLYDGDGQPLEGQGLPGESAHDENVSFGLALVWLWRLQGDVLEVCLQKRALTKKRWPGMYSTSAGGHINIGETPQQAALRECKEEIGVTLDPAKLSYAGTFRVATEPQNLRSVFSYQIEGDIDFRFDDGEVDAVEWMSYDECMTRANDPNSQLVMRHYGMDYMKLMMDHILREAEKARGV